MIARISLYIYQILNLNIIVHACKILQTLLALSAFWLDEDAHRSRHHITIQAEDLCTAVGWRMPKELVTTDNNPQQRVLGCRQYDPFCCHQSQRQKSISAWSQTWGPWAQKNKLLNVSEAMNIFLYCNNLWCLIQYMYMSTCCTSFLSQDAKT